MGRNKKLRKGIESLERQIQLHREKIFRENLKDVPDTGLINKWFRDIEIFEGEIVKKAKRLRKGE